MTRGARPIHPAMLVVAVFSRHVDVLDAACCRLEEAHGPIVLASPTFDFNQTEYYAREMGTGLRKRLLAFRDRVGPDTLPSLKRSSIAIEQAFRGSRPEPRPLNLDPGHLTLAKFMLATTKDQAHRLYLGDGIFGESTLHFQAGTFVPWPWTYADYRLPLVIGFLNEAREIYRRSLRAASTAAPH